MTLNTTNDKAEPTINGEWIGESSFVEITRQKLRSLGSSNLPVLVVGKTGTGKGLAARTLHDSSNRRFQPFVELCCLDIDMDEVTRQFAQAITDAQQGTLYVRNIHTIDDREGGRLKILWERSRARLVFGSDQIAVGETATSNSNLLNWLVYHCLNVALPTLQERKDDILPLIKYYQGLDSLLGALSFDLSATDLLTNFDWPENVRQLKRCLEKLAIQGESTHVSREILLDCFPSMRGENKILTPEKTLEVLSPSNLLPADKAVTEPRVISLNDKRPLERDIATSSLQTTSQDIASNAAQHPGLHKAIIYLYNHYNQPLQMEQLANHACMSPSHLSYLFKRYLGMSFKQVLLRLRIVKAMEVMADNPHRHITQVCDDVGFSDLSFFVRKFKATVGVSPGVYRDRFSTDDSSPEVLALVEDLSHPLLRVPPQL